MNRNQFRDLAYKTFMARWDIGPVSIYTMDGEKFTPPDPTNPAAANTGINWVRLLVRHSEIQQKTLAKVGRRKFEHTARVILQIFTVPNKGMLASDDLAQIFHETFDEDMGRGDVFGGAATYRERGTAEGWQMSEATVTFTYDEIR